MATVLGGYGGVSQVIAQIDSTYARADSMRRQLAAIREEVKQEREARHRLESALRSIGLITPGVS